jgi:cytochrome P450
MLHRDPGSMEPTQEGAAAAIETVVYFMDLVADKRVHPADDMISRLVIAEVDRGGGEPTRLDDEEIAGFAALLGGAGAETVTKLVANAAVLFARNPAEWQKVLDDPDLIPGAVEEVLRYWPPSQYQGRFSVAESTYSGVTIPAGYPTLLVTGSATHDERAFDRPDDFDIGRPPGLALGFGYGVHSCLGAALARLESRVAIGEMARRWPRYEIDESRCTRVQMSNVAGYASVPLRRTA